MEDLNEDLGLENFKPITLLFLLCRGRWEPETSDRQRYLKTFQDFATQWLKPEGNMPARQVIIYFVGAEAESWKQEIELRCLEEELPACFRNIDCLAAANDFECCRAVESAIQKFEPKWDSTFVGYCVDAAHFKVAHLLKDKLYQENRERADWQLIIIRDLPRLDIYPHSTEAFQKKLLKKLEPMSIRQLEEFYKNQ